MDPQKLSQLDPKLREAYQRVMGTVIPEPQAPVQAQTPPPPPPPTPVTTPASIPQPEPEPTIPPQPPIQPPVSEPQSISTPEPSMPEPQPAIPQPDPPPAGGPTPPAQANNFVQMNSEVAAAPTVSPNFSAPIAQTQTVAIKKKNGMMMPILFGIVILVFLVIYTLFWTKIFNLKLPFLP